MTVHGPGMAHGGDTLAPSSPDNTSSLLRHWRGCSISLLWKEEKVIGFFAQSNLPEKAIVPSTSVFYQNQDLRVKIKGNESCSPDSPACMCSQHFSPPNDTQLGPVRWFS